MKKVFFALLVVIFCSCEVEKTAHIRVEHKGNHSTKEVNFEEFYDIWYEYQSENLKKLPATVVIKTNEIVFDYFTLTSESKDTLNSIDLSSYIKSRSSELYVAGVMSAVSK
jgi:hypothetical protein